jgi:hypothetical protein
VSGTSGGAGTGVYGSCDVGYGVAATSPHGVAVHAYSETEIGLYAQAGTSFLGRKGTSGFAAGIFVGPVIVAGPLTVYGTKSAAVPGPDGSYRQLFCMQSPESWFEDFGDGQLVNGEAKIAIEVEFRSLVETKGYHVFLTPYGDCNGLYVTARTAAGFTVREQQNGRGNTSFCFRIVARRKDIPTQRLPTLDAPIERPPVKTTPSR